MADNTANTNLSNVVTQGGVIPAATVEIARPFPGTFTTSIDPGNIAVDPANNRNAKVTVTWTPDAEAQPASQAYVFVTTDPLPAEFNPPTPEQIYGQLGPFVDVHTLQNGDATEFEFPASSNETAYQYFAIAIRP